MALRQPRTEAKLLTEAELMALGSDARVEVLGGEVINMSPNGVQHHLIAVNVQRLLDAYVLENGLGFVFPDGLLYLLDANARGVKGAQVPDVSFVRAGRLPADFDMRRPFPGAPDLAVEVVSPGDDVSVLLYRVRRYLAFGTEQVWVVYPDAGEVHQYLREDASVRTWQPGETLDAGALLPGFALPLDAVFKLPGME
ncbi:MAG: Uma2 family endonuclease [Anaerolineae bacterium]|nr:Uma2 family endonuclease [Anaerolineae bacterium]